MGARPGRPAQPPKHLTVMRLDAAAAAFLEHMSTRLPAGTVATKAVIMRALLKVFGPAKPVWTLTAGDFDDVQDWIVRGADPAEAAARRAAGLTPRKGRTSTSAIAQVRATLRQFAEFCHRRDVLDTRATLLKPLAVSHKPSTVQEEHDFIRLPISVWGQYLDAAGEIHPRCRMTVALGLYCGRRISEIVRLQWQHIDLSAKTIRFYNKKRGRWFTIPLAPEMEAEIERWLAWAVVCGYGEPQPEWYLAANRIDSKFIRGANSRARLRNEPWRFPLVMTEPARPQALARDIKTVLRRFGLGPKEGTHTFRRSAATAMEAAGGLSATQEFLDHKTVVTTQRYTGDANRQRQLHDLLRRGVFGGASAVEPLGAASEAGINSDRP